MNVAEIQQALPGTSFSSSGMSTGEPRLGNSYPANNANYPVAQPGVQIGSLIQKSLPGVIVIVTLFALVLLYNWINTADYRPLYPEMPETEKSQAYDVLASSSFPVNLDSRTGDLMVPAGQYYEARMLLANSGFSDPGSSQSMTLLDEQSSLTTSQFMEEARYRAAIEGEIAKSIVQISSIKNARVHLAAPRQSSYVRNREPAKASVVVIGYPGRVITQGHVQSITNLVASSVPYLAVEDVSVVDQQGNLLTMEMNAGLRMADEQSTYKRSIENDYKARIEQLLAPIVGIQNVNSDVDASIDFSQLETTSEVFDETGRGPISRSEVLAVDRDRGSLAAGGIPGSQSNIVPNDTVLNGADGGNQTNATGPETVSNEPSSTRTTRNYELDRSIKYSRDAVGTITRLSIAVVINEAILNRRVSQPITDVEGTSPDDVEESEAIEQTNIAPTPQIDIEQLTELVKNSVGFDEARGDQVLVISSPFMTEIVTEEIETPWYEESSIILLIQIASAVIAFGITIIFVIRPVLTSLMARNKEKLEREMDSKYGLASAGNGYDAKLEQIKQLASSNPGKVAGAIKGLLNS
ncbi:flagellar basal-body MS-ring/collar protein FliF [bacterium]|nr:flagellar basal-body MS-ring/collar protein FliF [bacterium]